VSVPLIAFRDVGWWNPSAGKDVFEKINFSGTWNITFAASAVGVFSIRCAVTCIYDHTVHSIPAAFEKLSFKDETSLFILGLSAYRAGNTLHPGYKNN
jgi:hypothetical protein